MNAGKHRVDRFTHWTTAGVSILNGAVGDYLVRRNNSLAIDMAFVHRGRGLTLEKDALRAAYPDSDGHLCIFLHGLCCSESSWQFPDHDAAAGKTYGSLLHDEMGVTSLFVRYNTGLSIAENGRRLARLLDALLGAFPVPVREIVLFGHSMGGLVARSAAVAGGAWLPLVSKMFYFGTPHEGADLAKIAHTTAAILDAMPSRVSRLIGGIFDMRSEGIKDLREGLGATGSQSDAQSIRHYLVAGTLADDPQHPISRVLGDGLVRVPDTPEYAGNASRVRTVVFPGLHHMALAHDMDVYRQIKDWMREGADA